MSILAESDEARELDAQRPVKEDKPGFNDKMRAFFARFQFNSHYAIERAGWVTSFILVSFLVLTATAFYYSGQKANQLLGSRAMYTTKFTSSKTKNAGEVVNIYTDKSHKRAMVLMKFDNPATMSAAAKDYQGFITGSNLAGEFHPLKNKPAGSVFMFGSTGYMGVYINDSQGIKSGIMALTMRANSQLVAQDPDSPAAASDEAVVGAGGTSFEKYDQWRVFFNPGASGTKHLSALDASTPKIKDMYAQMIVAPQEKEIREKLDADLVQLKADLAGIADYTRRVTTTNLNGLYVRAPKVPEAIDGDSVAGQAAYGSKPSTLTLKTAHPAPNGFSFDWRAGSVEKGYLDGIVPQGQNYLTWVPRHMQSNGTSIDVTSLKWTMSDGTPLADQTSTDVGPLQQINANITLLTTAYQTYFNHKQQYEVNDLGSLLNLEMSLRDVVQNNTINDSKTAIKNY